MFYCWSRAINIYDRDTIIFNYFFDIYIYIYINVSDVCDHVYACTIGVFSAFLFAIHSARCHFGPSHFCSSRFVAIHVGSSHICVGSPKVVKRVRGAVHR